MDIVYKGHKATLSVEHVDYSDICFGFQHNIVVKIRSQHLRCATAELHEEEEQLLHDIAANLLVRAVDAKNKPKKGRPKKTI